MMNNDFVLRVSQFIVLSIICGRGSRFLLRFRRGSSSGAALDLPLVGGLDSSRHAGQRKAEQRCTREIAHGLLFPSLLVVYPAGAL